MDSNTHVKDLFLCRNETLFGGSFPQIPSLLYLKVDFQMVPQNCCAQNTENNQNYLSLLSRSPKSQCGLFVCRKFIQERHICLFSYK